MTGNHDCFGAMVTSPWDQVSLDEILAMYAKLGMPISREEAEKMLRQADEDYDGFISPQEFMCAIHTNEKWRVTKHLGAVNKAMQELRNKQVALYKAWQATERAETGMISQSKEARDLGWGNTGVGRTLIVRARARHQRHYRDTPTVSPGPCGAALIRMRWSERLSLLAGADDAAWYASQS